ncbi:MULTISPECIES: hypothetical protein [unclassified Lysobacter]|uniref:hypothetical protein n=1 Tax=unclassified Lysobacter TaxID=2635362 RepID=UPI000A70443B|nr:MULTISPECIES: hypothetical protein [unclassified Lysobacter]
MSWLAIVVMIVAAYFAFKVVKFAFKLLLWALVLGALYWVVAPPMGWPLPF